MSQKLIFWDWTGTLADESKLDEAICVSMEKEIARNEKISFDEAEKRFKDYLKGLENTWQWHDYTLHCSKFGLDWKAHQERNLDRMVLLPHAGEILEYTKSKGYRNIIATNAVRQVILLRLDYAGVSRLFDGVIASDDVKSLKADGKHFTHGLETFGGDVKLSFSVGDNPVQDVMSAKRVGLRTIFCGFGKRMTHYHTDHISGNHSETASADYTIKSLPEIKSIVK